MSWSFLLIKIVMITTMSVDSAGILCHYYHKCFNKKKEICALSYRFVLFRLDGSFMLEQFRV